MKVIWDLIVFFQRFHILTVGASGGIGDGLDSQADPMETKSKFVRARTDKNKVSDPYRPRLVRCWFWGALDAGRMGVVHAMGTSFV